MRRAPGILMLKASMSEWCIFARPYYANASKGWPVRRSLGEGGCPCIKGILPVRRSLPSLKAWISVGGGTQYLCAARIGPRDNKIYVYKILRLTQQFSHYFKEIINFFNRIITRKTDPN